MKGIECAFQGIVDRTPERRTSDRTGRDWLSFVVTVGEDADAQKVYVVCFGPAVDVGSTLSVGDSVYCEGKLSLRAWNSFDGTSQKTLSVVTSLVQPLGKIGEKRPKRKPKLKQEKIQKTDFHKPLPFNDELPI